MLDNILFNPDDFPRAFQVKSAAARTGHLFIAFNLFLGACYRVLASDMCGGANEMP